MKHHTEIHAEIGFPMALSERNPHLGAYSAISDSLCDRADVDAENLMCKVAACMMVIEHDHPPPKETLMNCPRCQTELQTRSTDGVEIDECPSCQGIWFDADELRQVKDKADPDLNWMDFELWKHADRFHVAAKPVDCPKCSERLVAIEYDQTGVEVNFCAQCRGVWLDAGELEKIIGNLSDELLSKDVSAYMRASLEEARELITGPESFLSEWKDFATVLRMLQYRLLGDNPTLGRALAEFQAKSQF